MNLAASYGLLLPFGLEVTAVGNHFHNTILHTAACVSVRGYITPDHIISLMTESADHPMTAVGNV